MTAVGALEYFVGGLFTRIFGDLTFIGVIGILALIGVLAFLGLPFELIALLGTVSIFLFVNMGLLDPAFVWVAWGALTLVLFGFVRSLFRGY